MSTNGPEKQGNHESSCSSFQSRKNKNGEQNVEETSQSDDCDLSAASNLTHPYLEMDSHPNEKITLFKSVKDYDKHSLLNVDCDKSPNYSDTSSSFAFILPPTPSSVSSSIISSAINITPNAIVGNFNNTFEANDQFTFSPKLLKEYKTEELSTIADIGSKNDNSYYRFPDVDSFTPFTIDEPTSKVSFISPTKTIQKNGSFLPVQIANHISKVNSTDSAAEKILHLAQNNTSLSNQATRRARLQSISLDSDGARLIEENLSLGIPINELVERSAGLIDFTAIEKHPKPLKITSENNYAIFNKHRSNLNLELNSNDQVKPLTIDKEHRLDNLFSEYNDHYEAETKYKSRPNRFTSYDETRTNQYSQILKPTTLTLNRRKANSLDSDQYLNYSLISTDREKNEQLNPYKYSMSSISASSLSVPTTPKRQFYRLPNQQKHGKPKQNEYFNDNSFVLLNSSPLDRNLISSFKHKLCSFDEKTYPYRNQTTVEDNKLSLNMRGTSSNQSNTNLRSLPGATSCNFSYKQQKPVTVDNPSPQNSHESKSSILHRRGSNHSLTLYIEPSKTLNKGLSVSNFSLGNRSSFNLESSSNILSHNQSDQLSTQPQPSNQQTKKNLLQRRGSHTSLVLNLQGSTNSLSRYNSHNSLNIHDQFNNRPLKKGPIERRNSNTSFRLFNQQNQALSVSNCNLPGSNCSLNSMCTYQTQNEDLMLVGNEQQVVTNNHQSKHCSRVNSSAENLNRLSLSCVQHVSRRKFLSSDSIHNIARSRVICGCQHDKIIIEKLRVSQNLEENDFYCESLQKNDQPIQTLKKVCACSMKSNGTVASSSMLKCKYATASANNLIWLNNCEYCHCKCNCQYALSETMNSKKICTDHIRKITTKPLSPQTTSEDFKIYLANIQFLQNASNFLSVNYMKNLHLIFIETYGKNVETHNSNISSAENNDEKLISFSNDKVFSKTNRTDIVDIDARRKKILKIHQEFWDLPTNFQEKPLVFGSRSKNRYKTILPNEHSRVMLNAESDSSTELYINANFIKGSDFTNNSYIATQGPMSNTVYDFWLMVYQNMKRTVEHDNEYFACVKQKIVMLTDFVENCRQKCAVYFPQQLNESMVFTSQTVDKTKAVLSKKVNLINDFQNVKVMQFSTPADTSINFNYFLITNVGVCIKNGYSIRKLLVIYSYQAKSTNLEISNAFIVYHYWYPDWPDHRSPENIDVLLEISMDILDNDCSDDFKEKSDSRVKLYYALPIVHCSAGIGRTGCLLAILNGLSQIRSCFNTFTENQTKDDDLHNKPIETQQRHCATWFNCEVGVDILGIVCNLRLQRGGMVQNSEQYELIHRVLCLFMQTIDIRGKI